ncbi:RING/U-box superfamily protein [Euphorbia peplus]|nr:RING/U-box superfamily protein [Euphorbia peplus]
MEESGGGGRHRSRDLAGLTLEAIIGPPKPAQPPPQLKPKPPTAETHTPMTLNRTLLDIIRDEEHHGGSLFGHKDKKSWKAFRDKLRLKRAGAAWTSTVPIPASDVPMQSYNSTNSNNRNRSLMSRRGSVRFTTTASPDSDAGDDDSSNQSAVSSSRPQMTRRTSSRYGSDSSPGENPSFRAQMSRRNSTRHGGIPAIEIEEESTDDGPLLSEERSMSAREAVAAQEAAEAAVAAAGDSPEEGEFTAAGEPVRMSLMDLLEETDRQMGVVGSKYTVEDDVDACDEEEEDDGSDGGDGIEHTCCVCMVRHKGAAFIPCGHTFCRLCSRELWAQRGNCPLCNGYILEILDIF